MIRTKGVELSGGNIVDVQDSYRYLGIPEGDVNHQKSHLKEKKQIYAISTYDLPVIRYPAGVTSWKRCKLLLLRQGNS